MTIDKILLVKVIGSLLCTKTTDFIRYRNYAFYLYYYALTNLPVYINNEKQRFYLNKFEILKTNLTCFKNILKKSNSNNDQAQLIFPQNTQEWKTISSSTMLSDMTSIPTLKWGDTVLRLEIEPPNSEVLEIARKELRENPDLARESIKELRELLKEEHDLKVPLDNDAWLVRFLRPCKFYPESARDLIKRYYAFKIKHANVYDGLMPSKEKNVFEQNILTVLPQRDQLGRRILILELGKKWKHNKCSLDEVYKGVVLFLEAAMLEPETQITGAVVIFDMNGLSLQQVWQFTPPFAKRIVDWLQDCVPLRIKNLHIVNQPYIFNMVFQLFKPFLREKLRSRIIFHGSDRASLHKYISPKCLPENYGGEIVLPKTDGIPWYDILLLCDKEYEAINSYGYKKCEKKNKS